VLLSRVRLVNVGPFDDLTLSFEDAAGAPRRFLVLFGGDGVGKTSLLSAIASTRPGYAVAQLRPRGEEGAPSFVVADWQLGVDDPARAHPLRVASPGAKLDEADDAGVLRRREQSLFDRRAVEGGFVLATFSGARWFSRSSVVLTTPDRSILRYDVRTAASFDDASRTDLARETKQVLSYIPVAAALSRSGAVSRRPRGGPAAAPGDGGTTPEEQAERLARIERALLEVLAALLEGTGLVVAGVDPLRLEPLFEDAGGRRIDFDDLGRSTRHVVAFGALTLRALAAAHPRVDDPRLAEGVVLVDDIEAQQPLHRQGSLASRLRRALPNVQWIATTSSPAVTLGCDPAEVVALRREPSSGRVELHEGPDAVLH
jgi:hypothetical protein